MKKRRITAAVLVMGIAAVLGSCGSSTEECCSKIYTEQEINEAVGMINERCEKSDTKVNYVEYLGDALCTDKMALTKFERDDADVYDECIGFSVEVSTPTNRLRDIVSDSKPMSYAEKTSNWWFARKYGGEWELIRSDVRAL